MDFKKEFKLFDNQYPLKNIRIDELTFHYRLGGKGKAVIVLLVGGLGIADGFYKHFKEFTKYFTVLTFDYPAETNRNYVLADGIARLLGALGLGKVFLVGQSYGGLIAQVVAQRHPDTVEGLILSNTGCLDADMDEAAKEPMLHMMKNLKRTIILTRLVPISLLRGLFLKRMKRHFENCTPDEKQYLIDLSKYMLAKVTNKHERHMCSLMADLIHESVTKQGMACFDRKVLLLLSEDDQTFGKESNDALVRMMPNPSVDKELSGGHLALLLKIEQYIDTVSQFILSVSCN